ncbi:DUF1801 domain-containing protein [Gemmobacter serpentinus]|uniref:DUF1801 domain-containing protein n=1 Tax=Gemmobacter serpentinus TaxID=2652247 RepID=UPI00124D0041|nr:DUF1801 domain-containing protein [Gemmobacter serpentinus]
MTEAKPAQVVLLSSGNPQIAKAYGDAPVQAYIAAMPGWKSPVGRRLDDLIVARVPNVQKAVKWNTPLYGMGDSHWFMSFYCMTRYIQITFFSGMALDPVPPVSSKQQGVRYYHIHEGDAFDADLLGAWIDQARALPGAKL